MVMGEVGLYTITEGVEVGGFVISDSIFDSIGQSFVFIAQGLTVPVPKEEMA